MTTGEVERQRGRAVYFLRVKEGAAVTKEGVETELSYGVVGASALSAAKVLPATVKATGNRFYHVYRCYC